MSWRGLVLAALLAGLAAPDWGLGQSGGDRSAPRLTDAERRLLSELRQKELAAEKSEILGSSNVSGANKDGDPNHAALCEKTLASPSFQQRKSSANWASSIFLGDRRRNRCRSKTPAKQLAANGLRQRSFSSP
jgi:hypothetical protein